MSFKKSLQILDQNPKCFAKPPRRKTTLRFAVLQPVEAANAYAVRSSMPPTTPTGNRQLLCIPILDFVSPSEPFAQLGNLGHLLFARGILFSAIHARIIYMNRANIGFFCFLRYKGYHCRALFQLDECG
ncbi:MAG: hypothetical protein ACOYMG_18190, partial [Candidatus Methylumidiphilus sp.]